MASTAQDVKRVEKAVETLAEGCLRMLRHYDEVLPSAYSDDHESRNSTRGAKDARASLTLPTRLSPRLRVMLLVGISAYELRWVRYNRVDFKKMPGGRFHLCDVVQPGDQQVQFLPGVPLLVDLLNFGPTTTESN
ncbi:hypothetical protein TOPH_08322 [Tolypocladium ophioglossoides CBS 100239]|uniref:Uncharacterized protein n=1 Tax=Tolypocladium ophioglossoides (strain CBS 100239) TaxID=1163406 RepID=A0A0L0MZ37_TOLOC|nr:hypothetical protein TOPH_08322 [Tolypocladium ophioglossoides CBS 100239]